jgi:hypothetical protein
MDKGAPNLTIISCGFQVSNRRHSGRSGSDLANNYGVVGGGASVRLSSHGSPPFGFLRHCSMCLLVSLKSVTTLFASFYLV